MAPGTDIIDWEKFSPENFKIAQKVIKIVLNFWQLRPIDSLLLPIKIPLQKFENEQVYLDDVRDVLNIIGGVKVANAKLLDNVLEYRRGRVRFPGDTKEVELPDYLPPEEELKNYVFLQISSLDNLHQAQNFIDKKLKEDAVDSEESIEGKEKQTKVTFDKSNKVLTYGSARWAPHKETLKKDNKRLKLFELLWETRSHKRKERSIQSGKPYQAMNLAREVGLIEFASNYSRDPKTKDKLLVLIKGINRELRNKKMPARIDIKGGIQLVITE